MSYFTVQGDVTLTHEDSDASHQATGPETTSMTAPSSPPFMAPRGASMFSAMTPTTKLVLGVAALGILYLLLRRKS